MSSASILRSGTTAWLRNHRMRLAIGSPENWLLRAANRLSGARLILPTLLPSRGLWILPRASSSDSASRLGMGANLKIAGAHSLQARGRITAHIRAPRESRRHGPHQARHRSGPVDRKRCWVGCGVSFPAIALVWVRECGGWKGSGSYSRADREYVAHEFAESSRGMHLASFRWSLPTSTGSRDQPQPQIDQPSISPNGRRKVRPRCSRSNGAHGLWELRAPKTPNPAHGQALRGASQAAFRAQEAHRRSEGVSSLMRAR